MQDFAKVVWSEGTFMVPQHLQQLDRYHESRLNQFIRRSDAYSYGIMNMNFSDSRLQEGVLEISELQAVFPDGTLFTPQGSELSRLLLKIPENTIRKKVFLVILPITEMVNEVSFSEDRSGDTRYYSVEKRLHDTCDIQAEPKPIALAKPNVRLIMEDDANEKMIKLPIAIVSSDNDAVITLDNDYIPPSLYCQRQHKLKSYISEIYGVLSQKSLTLASSVNDPNRGGSLELINFLMLQTVNRYLAYFSHQADAKDLIHPKDLFVNMGKLCGDLTTFLPERVVENSPIYNHNDLFRCFAELMTLLRKSLNTLLEQRALRIPLEKRDDTTYIAQTPDSSILTSYLFVLAAKADMPSESLRTKLPNIIKISDTDKLRQLVGYHLPGIKLTPLPTAPKELPYHSGFVYFELDKENELWEQFSHASGMALHLAGDFPNVEFELWAIKVD